MYETTTRSHSWVKHVITPVEVLTDDEGQPVVLVDPDQQEISEDDAAYGCQSCGASMALEFHTECSDPDGE